MQLRTLSFRENHSECAGKPCPNQDPAHHGMLLIVPSSLFTKGRWRMEDRKIANFIFIVLTYFFFNLSLGNRGKGL